MLKKQENKLSIHLCIVGCCWQRSFKSVHCPYSQSLTWSFVRSMTSVSKETENKKNDRDSIVKETKAISAASVSQPNILVNQVGKTSATSASTPTAATSAKNVIQEQGEY